MGRPPRRQLDCQRRPARRRLHRRHGPPALPHQPLDLERHQPPHRPRHLRLLPALPTRLDHAPRGLPGEPRSGHPEQHHRVSGPRPQSPRLAALGISAWECDDGCGG